MLTAALAAILLLSLGAALGWWPSPLDAETLVVIGTSLIFVVLGSLIIGRAVAGSEFETPWVVAATTLGAAALFNRVRRRMQGSVDRRFNRSRYDAQRVMDEFAGSLRDRVDGKAVVDDWIGVVDKTMQHRSIGVWLRV
jgi:hypothetical protein